CLPCETPASHSRVIDATAEARRSPQTVTEGVRRQPFTDFRNAWHRGCSSCAGLMHQSTIKRPVTLEAVGLHSGKQAKVTLSPAPEDTGIVFRAGDDRITAAPESAVNSHYATTIGKNGTRRERRALDPHLPRASVPHQLHARRGSPGHRHAGP